MINAQELRIGNIIDAISCYDNERGRKDRWEIIVENIYADGEVNSCDAFGTGGDFYTKQDLCFGIPLTEERLIKFGFEYVNLE